MWVMRWRSVIGFFAGAQFRLAVGIKTFQHLWRGEIGQQLADRLVQRELALLDQLHAAPAVVIALVIEAIQNTLSAVIGVVLGQVAFAERALIDHVVAGRGDRDDAGNFLGVAFLTQNLIDLSFALHGVASRFIFLK